MISAPKRFDRGDLVYLAYLVLPFRVLLQSSRALGWLEMLVRPRARRAVRANLEEAFGATKSPRELARLTRQVFEFHQMRSLLVILAPLLGTSGTLEKLVPFDGMEHLDRALAMGRGVMLLGAHVSSGGMLLAMIRLRQLGYDVRVPVPDQVDAWALTPFRRRIHAWLGAPRFGTMVGAFYAQFNVRPLVSALKQRAVLAMMGDGWHSASFVDVEFLGRRLPFTNGPLKVARLADVPVVPLFCTGPPDAMRLQFEPSFMVRRDAGTGDEEIERQVRFFIGRVERRMLADLPSWQHWLIEDVFGTLEAWRDRPLQERYAMKAAPEADDAPVL